MLVVNIVMPCETARRRDPVSGEELKPPSDEMTEADDGIIVVYVNTPDSAAVSV